VAGRELWIRADANKQIGMGHMMRCLTIAEAAGRAGIRTLFFTADEEAAPLLRERGQEYRILHTDFADMESELPRLFLEMEEAWQSRTETAAERRQETGEQPDAGQKQETREQPDAGQQPEIVLLADSYRITESYLRRLKQKLSGENSRLAILEDYGNVPFQADILINYNIYGTDFSYENNAPKALLGCGYMPLRQEFTKQSYEVREQVTHVLLTTGGSDTYRIAEKLVKMLLFPEEVKTEGEPETKLHLHVVCGKFSESLQDLRKLEEECEGEEKRLTKPEGQDKECENSRKRLTVYTDVKKMWELMARCDLALSAAGTTLYELCAVGVPTICFSFADNQILPGMAFEEHTPVVYAGDYEKNKTEMFAEVVKQVTRFRGMSREKRAAISENMRKIVDGKGAERIIEELWS